MLCADQEAQVARGNVFVRGWRYFTAALRGRLDERSDPEVQLRQAIEEARSQHAALKEQAANVIAAGKQTELKLDRTLAERDKLEGNAQQALLMAEDARSKGDDAGVARYEQAAESIATKLIALEHEVEALTELSLDNARAAEQARDAVAQNSAELQRRLSQQQQLLGQLEQARMAEQMNDAMASLTESVGADVPTFDEVRDRIEGRLARAQGTAELTDRGADTAIREVEEAARNVEAQARLSELRSRLGIASSEERETAAASDATSPSTAPEQSPTSEPG